jgi:hypothetical protein
LGGFLGQIRVDIAGNDPGAFLAEFHCGRLPYAPAGAGNDGYLASQPVDRAISVALGVLVSVSPAVAAFVSHFFSAPKAMKWLHYTISIAMHNNESVTIRLMTQVIGTIDVEMQHS